MKYRISYWCNCNIGNVRNINQDNFICNNRYIDFSVKKISFLEKQVKPPLLLGVFDGLGGEEHGETASFIAAKNAKDILNCKNIVDSFENYCNKTNRDICEVTRKNGYSSMGTTAAILAFTKKQIALCNIGDSRVIRFAKDKTEQISKDHIGVCVYGAKPPLLQNLGIEPSQLKIEPYISLGKYKKDDRYLICSDGLTDMVSIDEIEKTVRENEGERAVCLLMQKALANGGKDNITIILAQINKQKLFGKRG